MIRVCFFLFVFSTMSKRAIINCYKFSFFVRIVNMWNNLPKDIVHAGSLTLFRNRLKIYMNID